MDCLLVDTERDPGRGLDVVSAPRYGRARDRESTLVPHAELGTLAAQRSVTRPSESLANPESLLVDF